MNVVGLSGKAGTGKDYIATNYFVKKGYVLWSFSFHFKVWLASTNQATYEEVFHTKPPHVRKLLQEEGTERGRNVFGENIWIDTAFNWMRLLGETSGLNNFVIPDIRFPNEVTSVQERGGKVLRIVAPLRAADSPLTSEARIHPSETSLDHFTEFDAFIFNDYLHSNTVERQLKDIFHTPS